MNIVFLSPHFPPHFYHFCVHQRALGMNVLGIADEPWERLRPELQQALTEYYRVSDLNNYDELLRALGYFTHRYGKIDRIDSLNEHWLELEARLRTDFNVVGFRLTELPGIKRKSAMKAMFEMAGVPVARGQVARHADQVRAFIADVGLPVVAKPDIGVGANRTYKITTPTELEEFLSGPYQDYFIEEFVQGVIQTFDGLADRQGEPVYCTSMEYSRGVMEVVNEDDDIYYFTQRDIPADLEEAGRNILKIFDVRERFFHFEFFRTPNGALIALEVNMRPPGGLSLDMFNYASDIDLYAEWAAMLRYGRMTGSYSRPAHVCYVGRKWYHHYTISHEEVLRRYGWMMVHHQPMAQVFHRAMGSYGYLLRTPDLDAAIAAAVDIQRRA